MRTESNGLLERTEAAAPILQEIGRLARTAPPRIAGMLIFIRDHLFDADLSVHLVKKECRLRDNSIALHFHRHVGVPPGTFITENRLKVAERLLAETWLPIWKITELLGYSSIQVFSRAYYRRKGRRPSAFRRDGHMPVGPVAPIDGEQESATQPDLLRRALAGHLDDHEAAQLVCRLLEIYPPHRREVGAAI